MMVSPTPSGAKMTDARNRKPKALFRCDVNSRYLPTGKMVAEMTLTYGRQPDPHPATLQLMCDDPAGLRQLARELEHVADVLAAQKH